MANSVKGKVSINSDAVSQALSQISKSCTLLEGDIVGKIPGNFQVLIDLGLLSTAPSKLQKQVTDLVSVHKSIASQMSTHLDTVIQTDDNLYNQFTGGNNGSNYTGGNTSGGNYTGGSTDVNNQNDGKKITADVLVKAIPKIDDDTMLALLKFMNVNKNKNTELVDLLLDTSKSEELFVLLREAFGEKDKLEDVKLDDYKKVQKVFLEAIISGDVSIEEINEKSILVAKEYLINLSKNNNIKPSELLLDEANFEILKEGLKKLYDGKDLGDTSEETIKNFKKYVDNIAKENNISAEELLTNNLKKLL